MTVNKQDLEGKAAGVPPSAEQQLAKEREARALMRDRLRNTESLAAESQALRARMAQELERVTAERDRLRSAVAAASSTAEASAPPDPSAPASRPAAPTAEEADKIARAFDPPLKPPARKVPWRALAMLGGLAAGVAVLAWLTGSMPGAGEMAALSASASAPARASGPVYATASPSPAPAASIATAAAARVAAPAFPVPSGAVALPPLTPEAQLAAAPTAAGPAVSAVPAMAARLRTALDGEGIASPVEVDAATGHVMVADPQADAALRDRTDLVIRAVYAGAGLPEPQIEHRWLSPMRGAHATSAATPPEVISPAAAAYAARHAASAHPAEIRKKPAEATVADAQEPRAILPAGRVTAACKADIAGKSTAHRAAAFSACMAHSCCSAANRQTEECRAYGKAYPFTCSAN